MIEVLQSPNSFIQKQIFDKTERYRESKYLLHQTFENYKIVFNTFNDCCIVFDTTSGLNKSFLVNNWFLVPENFNEFELAKSYKDKRIFQNSKKQINTITTFTIIPTTDCNANCYYCFETGTRKMNMTPQIAEEVADYIIKVSDGKPVKLRWFGGEPLFNQLAIDTITSILYNEEINYTSSIITNGYLFNELFKERYKELWHLNNVQITLDGINEYYNAIKDYIYKDDKNPFETVISNIDLLINAKIKVSVRLNVTLDNEQELKDTIDYLYKKFGKNKYLSVYAHGIYELENEVPEQIFPIVEKINKYIYIHFGFNRALTKMIKNSFCMVDNSSAIVINPEGSLSLCEHHLDKDKVGNIKTGVDNTSRFITEYKERYFNNDLCAKCIFYPSCMLLKKCEGEAFCNKEKINEQILKQNRILIRSLKKYIKNHNNGNK